MATSPRFIDEADEALRRERLLARLTPRLNAFIPHTPHPKQRAALLPSWVREILYGGSAGPGKSDYILMAAAQYVDVPGYSALILRRTFPQLSQSDGLLPRAMEWFSGKAKGADSVSGGLYSKWAFPSGATITFGHMQYERDKYNYQGGAYQFIGFDELTQFTPGQYLYMFSRLRRPNSGPLSRVPLRVRGASNPGGVSHDFVRERFMLQSDPNRAFLPALLKDNPHLDAEEYVSSLSELHPYDREQLLTGNWDVRPPGSRFERDWFEIVDAAPAEGRVVRAWDLAATKPKPGRDPDWTAGEKWKRTEEGVYYVEDVVRTRATPGGIDRLLKQTAMLDGVGVPIRIEQEPGSSGKIAQAHFVRLLAGWDVRGDRPTGDKVVRANPVASQAEAGNIKLVRGPWNEEFLREYEQFTGDDTGHDDQVDAGSLAFRFLTPKSGWDTWESAVRSAPAAEEGV